MATNSQYGQPLSGQDAEFAAQPQGISTGGVDESQGEHGGQGPLFEADDKTAFDYVHSLVMRQEQLKKNQLAQDTYWTHVKLGRGMFYSLRESDGEWRCEQVRGAHLFSQENVPNKGWDLCNKTVETLMQDPAQPSPQTLTDSEEAERGAEMAEEFLRQDAGEKGTRDNLLFTDALDAATAQSAQYFYYTVDKTGGGYVPLQIKAAPTAPSPAQPTIGADGNPSTDLVLRYVTDSDPQVAQFTDDPSQAPPQWMPRIRIKRGGREHIRIFPETAGVADAEKVVWIDYMTLGEGKRLLPDSIGSLDDAGLTALSDWAPPRPLPLLPEHLRSRYKLRSGDAKQNANDGDERIFFSYVLATRPCPDYPRGLTLRVSGMNGGALLERDTLSAEVPTPDGKGTDVRCMDLPFNEIILVSDAERHNPAGKPLIERFGGTSKAQQRLIAGFEEALDITLHPARFASSVSPIEAADVEESRATGKILSVIATQSDWFKYEPPPEIPTGSLEWVTTYLDQRQDSMAGLNAPAQGADKQQEVSGTARKIAVNQALVAMSRMQQRLASSWERHWRLKLQLVQKEFKAPTLLRYVGEDGAAKQEWFSGVDFAQVGEVGLAPGSGGLLPPNEKISFIQQLMSVQLMTPDEARDAAMPLYRNQLGMADDPAQQRVERQVGVWDKGPPESVTVADPATGQPTQVPWVAAWQQFQQEQQQYQQLQAAAQEAQQHQQMAQSAAVAHIHPEAAPAPPQLPPPPTPPWTPFTPLPCDDEPLIAALRARRLSRLMNTARFEAQPPEWQQVVFQEYARMRNAVAASQAPQLPRGVTIAMKGDQSSVGAEEKAAMNPNAPQPAQQPKQAA